MILTILDINPAMDRSSNVGKDRKDGVLKFVDIEIYRILEEISSSVTSVELSLIE